MSCIAGAGSLRIEIPRIRVITGERRRIVEAFDTLMYLIDQ